MSAGFTPSPWRVVGDGRYIYADGEDGYICDIKLAEDDPEVIANANLIAAAPDLYAALSDLLEAETAADEARAVNAGIAALNKARGIASEVSSVGGLK